MKKQMLILVAVYLIGNYGYAQTAFAITPDTNLYAYVPNPTFPFGRPNPAAPPQIKDYHELIGICDCISITRNQDQTWAAPQKMIWQFEYILDGMAVMDKTLKPDGKYSGSIRQFSSDSLRWYVHYFSTASPSASLSTWEGNRQGDKIILNNPQKAPNGMDGIYRIVFSNISENGFNWLGAWMTPDASFVYETWKIDCVKRQSE
ncbi:MAG: hypothetical protein R2828_11540 [Saprospiraceae bacterium]